VVAEEVPEELAEARGPRRSPRTSPRCREEAPTRPAPPREPFDRPVAVRRKTQSGYEKRSQNLRIISSMNMEDRIHEVVIPWRRGRVQERQEGRRPEEGLPATSSSAASTTIRYVVQHARRHRLRRPGGQAVPAAAARRRDVPERQGRERGRTQALQAPPRVRARRDGAGQGRPLRRLQRRDRRDQRGPAQGQGARQHLRP
jgi:hypothetical protein